MQLDVDLAAAILPFTHAQLVADSAAAILPLAISRLAAVMDADLAAATHPFHTVSATSLAAVLPLVTIAPHGVAYANMTHAVVTYQAGSHATVAVIIHATIAVTASATSDQAERSQNK